MGKIVLRVKELYFRHRNNGSDILKGISFFVSSESITTILGPNGSGKTTIFKCLAGIWKYSKGCIEVHDRPIERLDPRERSRLFSLVPQEHEPAFPYTVFEVVLMGRAPFIGLFSSPKKRDIETANEALRFLSIEHLRDALYTNISGGERQLTLIARAIAQEAPIMLLDEPTSHLDLKNQIAVLKKIRKIAKERKITVLMTLHDPNLSNLFSDKVVVIDSGRKIAEGRPFDILNEELIKKVYDLDVRMLSLNGKRFLAPILDS